MTGDRDRIEPVPTRGGECNYPDTADHVHHELEGPADEPILRRVVFASVVYVLVILAGYRAARAVADMVTRPLFRRAGVE
jgi:hypothetical protein